MNAKLILIIIALLIFILFLRFISFYSQVEDYPKGSIITWQTNLLSQPKLKINGQQASVNMPNYQRVVVRFGFDPILSYGDKVNIQGELDYFIADNGNRVAYMSYPKYQIVQKGSESNLILRLRENIIDFFNSNLPLDWASLMLGIVFGIKEEMSPDFYLDLQKTGLLHVVAASGMNITMLGGFLAAGLVLFFRRQVAIALAIIGIVIYAILAGLEPSIVRAAIMGILVFLAQLTGRQASTFLVLFLAAFLMLMRSPNLIFDIGFQLSFMATFGLIFLRPIFGISERIKRVINRSIIGEDLTTTLTAQIMTLPILLISFGSISLWSVPVNAIILWTVPILMIIGGVAAIVGIIIEPLGKLILYLAIPLLIYFSWIVEVIGGFAKGLIQVNNLSITFVLGYYLIILSIILIIRKRE